MHKQVTKGHYEDNYDTLERFISYHYQIKASIRCGGNILDVGIGNGFVSNYLLKKEYNVTTCDFDADLKPDIIADIRNLPIKDKYFTTVLACEILEHIPWDDVPLAISELARITNKNVIISIPCKSIYLETVIKSNLLKKIGLPVIRFLIKIPAFFLKHKFDGEHYWELGAAGYSSAKFEKILKKYFTIKEKANPPMNTYHQFYILDKK